jgi:hypothetical protein
MPSRRFLATGLASTLALASAPSTASIIGGGPPGPGLGGDDLAESFFPNLNPNFDRHIVLIRETFDAIPDSISHEWGFYFTADPNTLYRIFSTSDAGPPEQVAVIDFDNGEVVDLDSLSVDATFTPSLGSFGFYLSVAFNENAPVLVRSEAALNDGGIDSFASFPYLANPLFRMVAFEVREQIYSFEVVDGAIPVPEPTTALLLAGGLAWLASRRRS